MVPKPNGSWRPCGDYRRLNLQTVRDRYPLPNIQDFNARLHGCNYFSKIDLVKAYNQIPMSAEDVQKTAIITPFGLFEFLYMPYGLLNAAQSFQRLMDKSFRKFSWLFTYLDDHLVASRTEEDHRRHLQLLFETLAENGFIINSDKCVFAVSSLEFLGHSVSVDGLVPLPKHVEAIQNFPPPQDVKQLQRFLGLVNFYRRFVPKAAATLKPLTDALIGSPKALLWTPDLDAAFCAAKTALVAAVPLVHPDNSAEISLATDASATHVGGVLQQREKGSWRPLSFFSKKLSPPELKYSAFDRELLAVYTAVKHFRFVLEGRKFAIFSDHKPLMSALHRSSPPLSARVQRQLAFIAEFTGDLRYLPGMVNVVADALSRPPIPPHTPDRQAPPSPQPPPSEPLIDTALLSALPLSVDFEKMAIQQSLCPDVSALRTSPSLKISKIAAGNVLLLGDLSTGFFRPLVPTAMRHAVFESIHGVGHPGMRATRRLVSARFVWHGLSAQVNQWTRECLSCQRGKVTKHIHVQAEPIPVPGRRFAHLHVDLVGPLPLSQGCSHLFTIVDRTTRWPEALPLASTTATACAAALFSGWIARFGLPDVITSDRGTQFTSAIWAAVSELLHIKHICTTAFHPQANGLVERMHRRLKDSLRARMVNTDWMSELPWVLLALRAAPREESASSAAEAVYGTQLVLPGQFLGQPESPSPTFIRDLKGSLSGAPIIPPRHNTAAADVHPSGPPEALMKARMVLVRKDGHVPPLTPLYSGPYLVLQRAQKVFRLKIGNREDTVSVHRLKPACTAEDVQPAQPPRRGRPPRAPPDLVPPPPPRPHTRAPIRSPLKRVAFKEIPDIITEGRPVRLKRPPQRYRS